MGQRVVAVGWPPSGAYVAVGGRKLPHHVDHQSDRGVGDAVGEHVGGVAHPDASFGSCVDVGGVVADTEVHDGAEVGKCSHQVRVDSGATRGHHRGDVGTVRRQELSSFGSLFRQHQCAVLLRQGAFQRRFQRADLQHRVIRGRAERLT